MENSNQNDKYLKKIVELLAKNEARIQTKELTAESDKLLDKAEKEGDSNGLKIQNSFDRIHDKLFTINTLLVALFIGFSKFPESEPIFILPIVLLPLLNIFYLVFLEKSQMEIYRHASQRMNWNLSSDVAKYGEMINRQNLKSLLAIIVTIGLSFYAAFKIIMY